MKIKMLMFIIIFAAVAAATRSEVHGNVFPPNARPFGVSQFKWMERYNQWFISIPADRNPMLDPDGGFCQENQSGPVFFLGSVFIVPGGDVFRSCTVPANKAIYLPVTGSLCSPFTDGTTSPEESLACARFFTDNAFDLFVEIDGRKIDIRRHRFSTKTFDGAFPAGGLLGNPGPVLVEDFVADGYSVMIPPLSVGHHSIRVGGKNHLIPDAFWDLSIDLSITRPSLWAEFIP